MTDTLKVGLMNAISCFSFIFISNVVYTKSIFIQADCAVLVVSASTSANLFKNGSPLEHVNIAYKMGVKHLIVAVNKMDATEPPYSKTRFFEIKKVVSNFLSKINYSPDAVIFIPVSGLFGTNIWKYSDSLYWYEEWISKIQNTAKGIFEIDSITCLSPFTTGSS